ncbi:MAG: hypothetical protein P8P83_03625 [Rickettsiaceae bacterium]|nr:hypothetical protein [Rickettsiaceae bacterium]
MKNFIKIAIIITVLQSSTYAMASVIALGPKIGTQGLGLKARTNFTGNLFGRVGINYLKFSAPNNNCKIIDKLNVTLFTVPVMLDWHPINESGFRISAGVAYNGNKVVGRKTATIPTTFNGITYSAAQIGTVSTKITMGNKISALLTLGYDSSLLNNSPWSINCEAGVMFGKLKLDVKHTGTGNDQVKADIKRNVSDITKDIRKKYPIYPIISVGFKYSF